MARSKCQDRYSTEVVVNIGGTMQMLGGRGGQDNAPSQGQGGWGQPQQPQASQQFSGGAPSRPAQQPAAAPAPSNEPPMDFDDDIPF